jgi:hypothetical protein
MALPWTSTELARTPSRQDTDPACLHAAAQGGFPMPARAGAWSGPRVGDAAER